MTGASVTEAVGCTRLSTREQENGYGQEAQEADIRRYAGAHGLRLREVIPEVESGAAELADRDVVQRYYALARAERGLGFVFPRVDRLGRHAEKIIEIARRLLRLGAQVRVVGYDKALDEQAPEWMMFQMQAMLAEQDYVGTVRRMRAGKHAKAAAGRWAHGRPPWGYVLERDGRGRSLLPVPVPEEAAAVLRCFELAVTQGETTVVLSMRREGWPAPTNAGWTRATVYTTLINERYTGVAHFGAERLSFPAIVEPALFRQVQAERVARRKTSGRRGTPHPFLGVLRCLHCGGAMVRYNKRGAYRYGCWRHRVNLQGRCDNARTHRAETLEGEAWAALVARVSDPAWLAEQLRPVPVAGPDRSEERADLTAAIARAWAPFTQGAKGYTYQMAEAAAAPYVLALERLEGEALAVAPAPEVDAAALSAQLREKLTAGFYTPEERTEILFLLGARIDVDESGVRDVHVKPRGGS